MIIMDVMCQLTCQYNLATLGITIQLPMRLCHIIGIHSVWTQSSMAFLYGGQCQSSDSISNRLIGFNFTSKEFIILIMD